ncbi:MAG: rRNA methyltransferase [Desulfurococcales archaeon]|nr:rRNA methyltransferase [Desulfurococcales archaeon]
MRVRIVLVGVEGPINLGFIARLLDNFDVDEFYLVSPRADLAEASRYAARAAHRLEEAIVVDSLDEAIRGASLAACTSAHASTGRDVLRVAMSPWEFAARALEEELVALVMGRESTGLTREEISKCGVLVTIPTSEKYRALNLSNATAILLYELYKARILSAARPWEPRVRPDEQRLALLYKYASLLAGEVAPTRRDHILRAIRNIIERSGASREEVDALLFLFSRLAGRLVRGN